MGRNTSWYDDTLLATWKLSFYPIDTFLRGSGKSLKNKQPHWSGRGPVKAKTMA